MPEVPDDEHTLRSRRLHPTDDGSRSGLRPRRAAHSRATGTGIKAVVIGAVVSALAAAVINPNVFSWIVRQAAGGVEPSAAPTPSGTSVELAVKSKGGAVTVQAPASWAIGNPKHNIFGEDTPGEAFSVGTDPYSKPSPVVTRMYVAVSHDGVERLGITSPSVAPAKLRTQMLREDWRVDGCALRSEGPYPGKDYLGVLREWDGCNGLADATMWEGWLTTADGKTLIYLQFNTRASDIDRATSERVLTSLLVEPDRLPPEKVTRDYQTG